MIRGLNHVTLSVSDLKRSLDFYTALLGFKPAATWSVGAYLKGGDLWLCLSLDQAVRKEAPEEDTHIAFTVSDKDFGIFSRSLMERKVPVWKENRSEGRSIYFLDPDGHKLEIHVGCLESRLRFLRREPWEGLQLY